MNKTRWILLVLALSSLLMTGCDLGPGDKSEQEDTTTVVMIPKAVGSSYYDLCAEGAKVAADELGIQFIYKGPTSSDSASQVNIIQDSIAQMVDVIIVAPVDPPALEPVLQQAKDAGIKVISFDTDLDVDSREVFVSQASYERIGKSLMDNVANGIQGTGEFAILTSSLTSNARNTWIQWIEVRMKEKYPDIKMLFIIPTNEDEQEAFVQTQNLINAYPELKGMVALSNISLSGAAKALKASERDDVSLHGIGLPNDVRSHIKDGTIDTAIFWEPEDLGYLTVHVADRVVKGETIEDKAMYGHLGPLLYLGRESILILDNPLHFDEDNIDAFDF